MKTFSAVLAAAGMATVVQGHGFITSPAPRVVGSVMEAACGQQVYYNQEGDNYGNIQGMLQVASSQTDYNAAACKIWMCKGYKYADNPAANIHTYTAGQVVPFTFDIRAPHTGVANVSIVRTKDNTAIGNPLISWDVFASNAVSIPTTETSFSVTIPSDLGSECSTPGACIIQHYWNAASVDQTYESCIDFTVAAAGNKAVVGSVSTSAAKSTVHVSTTVHVAPATTKAPVASTCACSPLAKRDQTVCETIKTKTVLETYTHTMSLSSALVAPVMTSYATVTSMVVPTNVTVSYVTVTETSTVTETTTVASSMVTAAAISTGGAANATSTTCTTKITLHGTGTGAPYPTSNGTLVGAIGTASAPYPYASGTAPSVVVPVPTGIRPYPYKPHSASSALVSPVAATETVVPYSAGNATIVLPTGTGTSYSVIVSPVALATAAPYSAGNVTLVLPTGTAFSSSALAAPVATEAPYPAGNVTLVIPTGTGAISAIVSAATGSAAPYAAGNVTIVVPTATGALYSALVSAVATNTGALPTGALTSLIPTTAPSAIPSGYGSANVTTPDETLPSGMTLSQLLEWIAYLLGKASDEADEGSYTKREVGKKMVKRAQAFKG